MSQIVTLSEAPTTGLGLLLSKSRFFVPSHQRDYRWDTDRVRQLLDDIHDAMERGDTYYFIGLMVFMQDQGRLRVLDGQQRLATIIIFASALRSWFGSINDTITLSKIESDFIGTAEYGQANILPSLELNHNNNSNFQQFVVQSSSLSAVKRERNRLNKFAPNAELLNAVIECHDYVSLIADKFDDENEARAFFHKLIVYIRDCVIAVRLTVPNESNAFRVFETLNDRGLDLSAVDLLKNYIFGLAHDVSPQLLAQIESRWVQITHVITNHKELDYLKSYWTSRYGRTQTADLFDDARKYITSGHEANKFTIDYLEAAEQYVAIESPDDPVWGKYTKKLKERLVNFLELGSKQAYPVILSGLARFDENDMSRLLWLMEVVSVRWQLIGGHRTGVLEIQAARLAHKIWSKEVTSASAAREAVSSVYVKDDDFHNEFIAKSNLTNKNASSILRRLESQEIQLSRGVDAKELGPTQALTLEHILPKNPGNEWNSETSIDKDITLECAGLIGNMCLLTAGRNRMLGRKHVREKSIAYAKSDLLLTKSIGERDRWCRDDIMTRQAYLASLAVKLWRF
ncbi:DUF262 domain-containing protein [Thalassobaculum sp.]|uniref:DUF262 domain-containing protein n=1 Tax=Thalassobaculum sp. TaxID=2022740 RepID=UPI0032EBC1C5